MYGLGPVVTILAVGVRSTSGATCGPIFPPARVVRLHRQASSLAGYIAQV